MAKIRGIKPEFWTDEDVVELSIPARLLFIGMWNFACDNGHLDDKPKQIKMRILPADVVDIDALLDELVQADRIERANGTITIPKFTHHQKPHKRWFSTCDQPWCVMPEGYGKPESHRGTTVAQPLAHRGTTADGDGDGDGDGDRSTRKRGTRIPDDFAITDEMRAWAKEKGWGTLDLDGITEEFFDYWRGVAGAKGVKLDWPSTWRNWIRRKAEDAKVRPLTTGPKPIHLLSVDEKAARGIPEGW